MRRVRIVTDSTADVPDNLVEELEIGVIYDYINFGAESLRDKIEISRPEFYRRLAGDSTMPTTAAPGVGEFEEAYRNAGAPEFAVISVHPSAHFSALFNSAVLAAQTFPEGKITVIDSGQLSMGLGWQVIAAARAAQVGESVGEIVQLVTAMKPRTRVLAALDTLEYLRRSGRVGWTKTLVGALLRIKPIIEVRDGEILPLDRVRTSTRSMNRLVESTETLQPLESLAILHTNWPEGAAELSHRLGHLSLGDPVLTLDVTPVIGVHAGPKALGVAVVAAAHSRAG